MKRDDSFWLWQARVSYTLARSTSEAACILHIFQPEKSVVHYSTGQTCMFLHCSTCQSELYAAEAENLTSCV